jgi:hypothetical protein
VYPIVVVPIHPFHRGFCHISEPFPRATQINELPLVQAVERFRSRIIVGIAFGADGTDDTEFIQPVGVTDRSVLHTTIGMVDQAAIDAVFTPPYPHLQSIEGQLGA